MNTDIAKNEWSEVKGKIKKTWSKFSDSEVEGFKNNLHLIADKVQKTYSITKEKAKMT